MEKIRDFTWLRSGEWNINLVYVILQSLLDKLPKPVIGNTKDCALQSCMFYQFSPTEVLYVINKINIKDEGGLFNPAHWLLVKPVFTQLYTHTHVKVYHEIQLLKG